MKQRRKVIGMHYLNQFGLDLYFTRESLKTGVLVSLLSVWVLVGLFYYLNRYTKRRYFTIWTAAWLFYALWITLSFGVQGEKPQPLIMMFEDWCVGVAAVFLLWGSQQFLGERVRQQSLGWFMAFLLVWSYIGAYYLEKPLQTQLPLFGLIGIASLLAARSFLKYRRQHKYVGATLLMLGFALWGSYMMAYPLLEGSEDLVSLALFLSATIQIFLAVSMIILVLEEVRQTHQIALEQIHSGQREREVLQTRVTSTEERYRQLFDQASEAIIIVEAENLHLLELNRAAEHLLGIARAEAGQHALTSFCQFELSDKPTPQSGDEWFQLICHQQPLTLVRKNGSVIPVEASGARVNFDGQSGFQFFMRELTERAQLEQQLRQAEKLSAIGQMISGIAHELNNPLTVVKGYLELILTHHKLNPRTRADLEKVSLESSRAAKLVNNFLAFAHERSLRRESVNFNDLIRQIVDLRKFDLKVAAVQVQLDLDPALPETTADPDQVQQVLVNLLSNALQALVEASQPRQVKIGSSKADKTICLSVEDNGPGVPQALMNRIFEPFFTTKEVGVGTGLGLSIAHSIMTEHNGKILCAPSSLGGARFVLEFPLVESRKATEINSSPALDFEADSTPAAEILVLDDEKAIADMLAEILEIIGHKVSVCCSPVRALELLDTRSFDLVISDFRMPGLNGQQFYEQATEKYPSLARRIVFLTGDVVNESTLAFLQSIGNPHLAKPFNLKKVQEIVAAVLKQESQPVLAESATWT